MKDHHLYFSIVLATYNRDLILEKTLNSFLKLTFPSPHWECIVVDNACREETRKLVERYRSIPVIYCSESKPGKNNALLRAIPYAKGAYLIFTDDDIIASPSWLDSIRKGVQNWPDADIFGGKILPSLPTGYSFPKNIPLDHTFTKTSFVIADWDLREGPIDPKNIYGPNMIISRNIIDSGISFNPNVGPSQDKNYTMGSETDFLMRAGRAGYKSIYLPDALVYHQIRPEQLSLKWLSGRALRSGKGKATVHPVELGEFKIIAGTPRFLFRNFLEHRLLGLFFKIIKNHERAFHHMMSHQICKGEISVYLKNYFSSLGKK